MTERFRKGDLVHIAADLGPWMSHFAADIDAVVLYSYGEKYGGGNSDTYALHIKGKGFSAWYDGPQLTLIRHDAEAILAEWEAEEAALEKLQSDHDWIFSHGMEVLEGASGATVQRLADDLGITGSLWGSHGEGFDYWANAMKVLGVAEPFLHAGDKDGWIARSASIKALRRT